MNFNIAHVIWLCYHVSNIKINYHFLNLSFSNLKFLKIIIKKIKMNKRIVLVLMILVCNMAFSQNRFMLNQNVYINITNNGYLVVDNANTNAITSLGTGGNIISEGENNVVKWNINTSIGNYIVPFCTSTLVKIPLAVNIAAAGVGASSAIIFSTYETATDANTAYPSDVTNMNSNCGNNNGLFAVDRFWRIDAGSYTTKPTPVIKFVYNNASNEIGGTNTIIEPQLKAQRFNSGSNSWETPQKLYGLDNSLLNYVSGVSVTPTDFFKSWTLIDTATMALPISIASVSNNTICSGSSTTITASGATTYTLLPGSLSPGSSFIVSPISSTTYTISGTLGTGTATCKSTTNTVANTLITVNTTPTVGITSVSNSTICSGNSSVITPNGATSYTLLPINTVGTSFTVSPSTTTAYTITGSNASGCIATAANSYTFSIIVNTTPTVGITSVSNNTICSGNSSVITPSGASSYTILPINISGSSFTVSPTSTITYTINGADASGVCISSMATNTTVTINVNATPIIGITSISNGTICLGNSSIITPSGASSYTLLPTNSVGTSFTVSPTVTSTYTINGINVLGCVNNVTSNAVAQVIVDIIPLQTPTVTNISCNGSNNGVIGLTILGGTSSYTFTWSNGSSSSTLTNLSTGGYTVTILSVNSCSLSQNFIITEPSSITLSSTSSSIVSSCQQNPTGSVSLSLTGGTPSYQANWSNGVTGLINSNIPAGVYTATVTDQNNCFKLFTFTIDTLGISNSQCVELLVPELFSPNGDGKNDLFVISKIEVFPNNMLSIYNRWGSLVYQKKSYNNSWNGKPNVSDAIGGGLLPAGTYFIILDFGDGISKVYNGYVELQY